MSLRLLTAYVGKNCDFNNFNGNENIQIYNELKAAKFNGVTVYFTAVRKAACRIHRKLNTRQLTKNK